jgi:predicted AAA+ superfamily ATPase
MDTIRTLNSYTSIYLKEEIINEALTRNLNAFSRFLDIAADSSGEIINYSNIARETGVASKTIREYYQILEDTLIAFHLEPYYKSQRKRIIEHPKYYLFDNGIINCICGRLGIELKPQTSIYGKLFEHFIILETNRLIHYYEKPWRIYFWRTSHGAEVDMIIEKGKDNIYAVEIKSSEYVSFKELNGLKQFSEVYPKAKLICVCRTKKPYIQNNISFLPWKYFFEDELGF